MRCVSKRGFTFIEVMFAVMVLGIGLIGLAAALTVGSANVQSTFDDSTAARVAASAYATLSQTMTQANTTPSDSYQGFDLSPSLNDAVKSQLILSSDPRFAWIPVYIRPDGNSTLAQVIIVAVRCESGSQYTSADIAPAHDDPSGINPPTLSARSMTVTAAPDPTGGPDRVTFAADTPMIAPGAIIISKSSDGSTPAGRIFKIGELIDGTQHIWSLAPGYDLHGQGGYDGAAIVVGRAYADPNNPAGGFAGGSQALAAYAMMIQLQ